MTNLLIIASAVAAIIYGFIAGIFILRLPTGNDKMKEIAKAIQTGAKAFLNRQYRSVAIVAAILFLLIGFLPSLGWSVQLLLGQFFPLSPVILVCWLAYVQSPHR